jgi:hypothetical protein
LIANVKKQEESIDNNIMLFLNQFNNHKDISMSYITLANIYLYSNNNKLKNIVKDIVNKKDFIKKKIKESEEISDLLNIIYLIDIFKIDVNRNLYHKFIINPYKYTLLMDILINTKYRVKCINLLDESFKDEDDENYISNLYNILELLSEYPYLNNNFIIRGLNNNDEDIINKSIEVLYEWNRNSDDEIKDTEIYPVLLEVKNKDISKKIIDSINNLIGD